jgi:hypothetical protein
MTREDWANKKEEGARDAAEQAQRDCRVIEEREAASGDPDSAGNVCAGPRVRACSRLMALV